MDATSSPRQRGASDPVHRPQRPQRTRRFLPRTIRGTLVLLLLLVIVPTLMVEVSHYYNLVRERRAQEFQNNLELARAVAGTFDAYVQDVLHQELALGTALSSPQPLTAEQTMRLLSASSRAYPSIRHFAWASPQGRIVASVDPQIVGLDLTDRPYYRGIVQGQEWGITDLFRGTIDGEARFVIARGIRDERGALQGIVTADIDPRRLDSILGVERAGSAAIVIIDSRGWGAYRYPEIELPWEQRNWIEVNPVIGRALAGEEISEVIVGSTGEKRMASYTLIRPIGWVASASREQDEVMAPVYQDLTHQAGQEVAVIVGAFLAALLIGRSITVPMRRLREQATALGRREPRTPVRVEGLVELEELSDTFNRVAADIRAHEEQRESFIHTISHDLRNPLTIIIGQAQLLRRALDKAGLKGTEQRSVEAISTSARRMSVMIQDLVDSARLEAGELHLERRPLPLGHLVSELLERTRGVMEVERIRVDVPSDLPPASADPDRLERILVNLLSNAVKYSPPPTEVLVTAREIGGEIVVSISDRGIGITPQDLPHIFERFYRAKASRRTEGLGLGLYITKVLVEAHGGRIWVESEPGKGSTFYFTLLKEGLPD